MSADRRGPGRPSPEAMRRDWLKLRSVVWDRTTALPAYPMLFDQLRAWLDERPRVGVLHVEIEGIELVESLYGWQMLDRVLARAADALRERLGPELGGSALLALDAVGGHRFAIFLEPTGDGRGVELDALATRGASLAAAVAGALGEEPFAGLGPPLRVRAGHAALALSPFQRFERRVHAALDEARARPGRADERRDNGFREDLRRVIRDADLHVQFQPVVHLETHEILGYEALARGPADTPLESPAELFALSDRYGVAADLDRACRKAAWRACGAGPRRGKLFLNVLPQSLPEGPRPERVVLEFSERAADGDADRFLDALERAKAEGYEVALDDLGTGYSSQAILERVRPDYLKLDVSLVRQVDENLIKQEILRSLVRIAERIGASVIAEGVETEDEARVLLEAGARYGQGFLFARPADRIEDLERRLAEPR